MKNLNKLNRSMNTRIFPLVFLLFSALLRLFGQPTEPILRLNSGFHTASIRSISTNTRGDRLLTVSEDKTARLWFAHSGIGLRVFRPPIGLGDEGLLFAGALSPCGNFAAVGGNTGGSWNPADSSAITFGSWTGFQRHLRYSVYLFSTQTGEMLRNIDYLEGEIRALRFTPDGKHLAVGLSNGRGIVIVNIENGRAVQNISAIEGSVVALDYSNSGQLAVISDDSYLRVYSRTYQLVNSQIVDGTPFSVAFSPVSAALAVGGSVINLFDRSFRKSTLSTPSGSVTYAVAYSSTGVLHSGEMGQDGKSRIIVWRGSRRTEIPAGAGRITSLVSLAGGSMAYATSHPEIARIMPDNLPPPTWTGTEIGAYLRTADMVASTTRQHDVFQVNYNATEIGLTNVDSDVLFFSLPYRELKVAPSNLPRAVYQNAANNLNIENWKNSNEPTLNGRALNILQEGEISRSVDISASGNHIFVGTNRHIMRLDRNGIVRWRSSLTEECVAVKISGDEKTVVIALSNGAYAWYDIEAGARKLTLFVHPEHRRWILWTPQGYYDASAGAEDFIGWNVNQNKNMASSFFPVAHFRSVFHKPAMIDQIAGIDAEHHEQEESQPAIVLNLPPEINIISPQFESSSENRAVRLEYTVKTNSDVALQSLRVLVNGRPVQLLPGITEGLHEIMVEIPEADSEISLIARNEHASSVPASVRIEWTGVRETDIFKPNLYVLAVGVSDYVNPNLSLQFAAKDANDFANVMAEQQGLLYRNVTTKLLTNEAGSKDNILDGLDWIQSQTTSRDVAMLFFAGHGMNDNIGNFFYMPVEADPNRLRVTCINYVEIKQSVAAIAGKVILFMDACHSGDVMGNTRRRSADINRFVNELASAENGAVVFTSSTGRQYSLEDPAWNNGAFTKALVEGLSGKADLLNRNSISIKTLDLYISQRVKELTNGQQAPTTIIPSSIPDFPIAVRH